MGVWVYEKNKYSALSTQREVARRVSLRANFGDSGLSFGYLYFWAIAIRLFVD